MIELIEIIANIIADSIEEESAATTTQKIARNISKGLEKRRELRKGIYKYTQPGRYLVQKTKFKYMNKIFNRFFKKYKTLNTVRQLHSKNLLQNSLERQLKKRRRDKIRNYQQELKKIEREKNTLERKIKNLEKEYATRQGKEEAIKIKEEITSDLRQLSDLTRQQRYDLLKETQAKFEQKKQEMSRYKKELNKKYNIDLFNRNIHLSSSFLNWGIYWYKGDTDSRKNYKETDTGTCMVNMRPKNQSYYLIEVPIHVWVQMVRARGVNGTGAGSVLWSTIWDYKRSKSREYKRVKKYKRSLMKNKVRVIQNINRSNTKKTGIINMRTSTRKRVK